MHSFLDSVQKEHKKNYVPLLVLHDFDTTPSFYFTYVEKSEILFSYIYKSNRRIVGYMELDKMEIIVLSTLNSIYDFEWEFYQFVTPTNITKRFDYICFPNDLYYVDKEGEPRFPAFFDPVFKVYLFKNNKFEEYVQRD